MLQFILNSLVVTLGITSGVILLLIALFKYLEYSSSYLVTDVNTKKPIGNMVDAWQFMKMRFTQPAHLFELTHKLCKNFNFENYVTFHTPWIPFLVISNAEDAKKVLINWKEFPKATKMLYTPVTRRFLGENLVFVNHEQWKTQRSIMNPAFQHIERFSDLFVNETFKCFNAMKQYASIAHGKDMVNGENEQQMSIEVPTAEFATALTLDVLGLSVFGYKFELLNEVAAKASGKEHHSNSTDYVNAYKHLMSSLNDFGLMLAGKFLSHLPLAKINKLFACIDKMDELVFSVIKNAKLKKEKSLERHSSDESDQPTLLDLMIGSTEEGTGRHLTDKELRDNVIVFFLAGHETTASSLAATMFSLAKNKRVQEKLIDEIDRVLGTDINKPLNCESLKEMEYLEWVIKEGLRKFPPVVLIPARTVEKSSEVIGNIRVKQGAVISIHAYNIHHNPKYWKEPEEFRPERFSPEESKGRPSTAWIPFGGGARFCIGNLFSMLEQRIFLCLLLQRYTLELPDDITEYKYLRYGPVMAPDPSMRVILKPRH